MPICKHKNLSPLEVAFAKIIYPNGYKAPPEYDYSVSIFNANIAHVKKYLCMECGKVINAPNIYSSLED